MSDLDALRLALMIGAVSHEGDGWFASDAGYGYEEADAAIEAGWAALARLDAAAVRPAGLRCDFDCDACRAPDEGWQQP